MENATLKPYPDYKPSGVEWLGDVPAHWEMLPGRACYEEKSPQINTGLKETTVLSLSYGEIVIKPPKDLHGLVPASFETYQIIEPRDIIVRPTDLQNDWNSLRFGLNSHRGIITSAYMCLATSMHLSFDYGHLVCHAYDLKKVFYGLGSGLRQNLSWKDFKYLPCPVPPLEEQTAIVRYLDHADERIRRAISAKERLIELLTEQRQAVIHRAVTRGLDPNVPLKPSRVEWLGDVPKHWEVRRVKELAKSEYKSFVDGDWIESPYITDRGIRLIQTGNIGIGQYREKGYRYISQQTFHELDCTECQPGDVLICRLGVPVARACLAPDLGTQMITSVDVCIFKPRSGVSPQFLVYQMSSSDYLNWVNSSVRGSTRDRISRSMLGTFSVVVPPLDEQTAIVRYIDKATTEIDTAIDKAQRQIDLLREYRTRLIADVVTGQVDVRGAVGDEVELPVS